MHTSKHRGCYHGELVFASPECFCDLAKRLGRIIFRNANDLAPLNSIRSQFGRFSGEDGLKLHLDLLPISIGHASSPAKCPSVNMLLRFRRKECRI